MRIVYLLCLKFQTLTTAFKNITMPKTVCYSIQIFSDETVFFFFSLFNFPHRTINTFAVSYD